MSFVVNLGYLMAHFITDVRAIGGLQIDQAKRLKELEAENNRLKRAVVGTYSG